MTLFRTVCAVFGTLAAASAALAVQPVALSFDAPKAEKVCVAGSFDPWWQKCHPMKKDSRGRWSAVLDLDPGRYELLFLVDGQWLPHPDLPTIQDALGSVNNVLQVLPRD